MFSTAAASAPSVTARPPASSPTSATLTGTVNPNGRETTWYFEYGTNTNYGTKTPAKNAGAGTSAMAVIRAGDRAGVGPHLPLPARRDERRRDEQRRDHDLLGGGRAGGDDRPVGRDLVDRRRSSGARRPQRPGDELVLRVRDEHGLRRRDAAKNAGSGTKAVSESASITGLEAGTTYHFRLVATNASGTRRGRPARSARPAGPPSHGDGAGASDRRRPG